MTGAIKAFVDGGASPSDTIALTRLLEAAIRETLGDPKDHLDEEIQEQAEFVFNQILQNLRKTGWSQETLKNVGQMMLRFWNVLEAYKDMKQSYTLEEWMVRFDALAQEARKAFGSPL